MMPKGFFFSQLLMCFTLFKKRKIPIINSTVAIETIVSMKTSLRNFLITISEYSMFTFIIVEPVAIFKSQFNRPFWILKDFWHASVLKIVIVIIESQTKQVFFLHGSHFPLSQIWITWL